jgi:hypothetical protein
MNIEQSRREALIATLQQGTIALKNEIAGQVTNYLKDLGDESQDPEEVSKKHAKVMDNVFGFYIVTLQRTFSLHNQGL